MVHENISAGRNYEFFILPFFAMRRISNLKEKSFKTKKTVEKIFLLFLRKFEEFGLSMSCAVRRQEGCLHRVLRSSGERLAFSFVYFSAAWSPTSGLIRKSGTARRAAPPGRALTVSLLQFSLNNTDILSIMYYTVSQLRRH